MWICTRTCLAACVRAHAYVHGHFVQKPEDSPKCHCLGVIEVCFLSQGLFSTWSLPGRLVWLTGLLQRQTCLHLSSSGVTSVFHHAWLSYVDLGSGIQVVLFQLSYLLYFFFSFLCLPFDFLKYIFIYYVCVHACSCTCCGSHATAPMWWSKEICESFLSL